MTTKFTHQGVIDDSRTGRIVNVSTRLRELKHHWVTDGYLKFRKGDGSCVCCEFLTLDLSSIKPLGGGK